MTDGSAADGELPLSADALVDDAIDRTGLDDIGGDEWRERTADYVDHFGVRTGDFD